MSDRKIRSAEDLRERFLLDNADFVLDELAAVLRGEGEFSCQSSLTLGNYLETLHRLVERAADKIKLDALSIKNITAGVASGKMSASVAQQCMDLLKTQQDIEELPKLLESMQNILDKQKNE
jgi:hypothetical protein